jgi:hypothetical protein
VYKTTHTKLKPYIHIEGVFEKRPNETVEHIRERGKKIAIDTYYFEKAKQEKINH